MKATFEARVRQIPCCRAQGADDELGAVLALKGVDRGLAGGAAVRAQDVGRGREALQQSPLDLDGSANTTSGSPEARKSPIQLSAVGSLPAAASWRRLFRRTSCWNGAPRPPSRRGS